MRIKPGDICTIIEAKEVHITSCREYDYSRNLEILEYKPLPKFEFTPEESLTFLMIIPRKKKVSWHVKFNLLRRIFKILQR